MAPHPNARMDRGDPVRTGSSALEEGPNVGVYEEVAFDPLAPADRGPPWGVPARQEIGIEANTGHRFSRLSRLPIGIRPLY